MGREGQVASSKASEICLTELKFGMRKWYVGGIEDSSCNSECG